MTEADVNLVTGETLMDEPSELMYRQITPHMMDGEKIASAAFGPYPVDSGKPSYSRSSAVEPQDARDWHNRNASSVSLSVWAVSVAEVIFTTRPAIDDSASPLPPGKKRAPGHCYIDFRGLTPGVRKSVRGHLYFRAIDRGEIPTEPTTEDGELFALPPAAPALPAARSDSIVEDGPE